jgi:hypothetical protein
MRFTLFTALVTIAFHAMPGRCDEVQSKQPFAKQSMYSFKIIGDVKPATQKVISSLPEVGSSIVVSTVKVLGNSAGDAPPNAGLDFIIVFDKTQGIGYFGAPGDAVVVCPQGIFVFYAFQHGIYCRRSPTGLKKFSSIVDYVRELRNDQDLNADFPGAQIDYQPRTAIALSNRHPGGFSYNVKDVRFDGDALFLTVVTSVSKHIAYLKLQYAGSGWKIVSESLDREIGR